MSEKSVEKKSVFRYALSMIDATMIRFLIVGVINTLVGTSTMFLLYNCAGQSYYFSSAANYVIGGICSFFLNKFFTFKAREKKEENLKNKLRNITFQAVKFALTVFISYIISYTLSKKIVSIILVSYSEKIRDNIAMLCGMCGYVVLNYLAQRLWVFRKRSK